MARVFYYYDLGFRDSCKAAIEPLECVCLCVLLRVIEAENNTLGSWRGGLVIPPD